MSTKLFIGGLAWSTDDRSLRSKFEEFGPVKDAVVIQDRETGRSKGFGFVTFGDAESANRAISSMDNKELDGRVIRVQVATEREGGASRGGNGGRRFGGERQGGFGGRGNDRSGENGGW